MEQFRPFIEKEHSSYKNATIEDNRHAGPGFGWTGYIFTGKEEAQETADGKTVHRQVIAISAASLKALKSAIDRYNTKNSRITAARSLYTDKSALCPKYGDVVLPDENGMCSLCGLHAA